MNKDPFDFDNMLEQWVEQGDWLMISNMFRQLDPMFIIEHAYCFAWGMITELIELDEYEMERYCRYWYRDAWMNACQYQKMSEKFMRNHYRDLDWEMISHYQHLSQDFMIDFKDYVYWPIASCYQIITPETLEVLRDYVIWEYLPLDIYDERWVIEHVDRIGWSNLPFKKQFSEQLIREYYVEMDWGELSSYQTMTEDFIREFENDITFNYLLINPNCHFGKEFISKYIHKIGKTTWKSQKDAIIKKYGKEFYNEYYEHFQLPAC